ncbi:MAG: hypothetical protein ACLFUI_01400 [Halanaerobiales bacterium]
MKYKCKYKKYKKLLLCDKLRSTFSIIFIFVLVFIFINTTAFAEENAEAAGLYNLPEVFFQEEWVESEDNIVVYLLNFHQLDNQLIETTSLKGYFSDESDSETRWQYLGKDGLIEFRNILGGSNSISMESISSVTNKEKNYTSWLIAYPNNSSEISLRERYIGLDRIKRAEDERLLEISLNPRKISYQGQQIFSEFSFHYGSSSQENRYETALWLNNTGLETLAVVSRKFDHQGGYERRYYAIQLAAVVVSSEQLSSIDGNFMAIGNLTELNEMFDNVDIANTDGKINASKMTNKLTVGIGNHGEYIVFDHMRGSSNYSIELNRNTEYDNLGYLINADLSLLEKEGLFLSLRISNQENIYYANQDQKISDIGDRIYSPILRLGLLDQLEWNDNFRIALAYYPLSKNTRYGDSVFSDRLWQLRAEYDYQEWNISYEGNFTNNNNHQQIEVEYQLDGNKDIALTYGFDYNDDSFVSLAYCFPI